MGAGTLRFVHDRIMVDAALELSALGLTATEISRRLGVAKSTVQYWCRGGRASGDARPQDVICPRCHGLPLDEPRYVYLAGYYLGDGHITVGSRTAVLWLYCADDWPGVSAEVQEAVRSVLPARSVSLAARTGCHAVKSHSKHWLCLFPQHGVGPKHARPIVLEPWQQELVEKHPGRLLRGLFHSDGCRVVNWAPKRNSPHGERYEYPRYLFSNKSEDILGICAAALDLLDIPYRHPRWDMISVARRAAVAALDEHVGPKY